MNNNLHIVCFLWQGTDRPGWDNAELGVDYVNRLYSSICRHLKQDFIFYCFTDIDIQGKVLRGVNIEPLNPLSWAGCLPKLEIHNKRVTEKMPGRIIVFDLDTVVIGDLADIVNCRESSFITRAWFIGIKRGLWVSGGDLLSFDSGATAYLYDQYQEDPALLEQWTGGRERFVYREWATEIDYWQRVLSDQVISYKRHIRGRAGVFPHARVVSVHGSPRPHEINEDWLTRNWRI